MTQAEKQVLEGIVQVLHNLTVRIDSVEGAAIHSGLLPNGLSESLAPNYVQAANNDLQLIRGVLASMRTVKA